MDLYIAEKPSLAVTLATHLNGGGRLNRQQGFIQGDNWIMTWCIGHLYELAEPDFYNPEFKRWSIESLPIIPSPFEYRPSKRTKKQLDVIHSLCKKATRVFNCGDPDREGQLLVDMVIEKSSYKGDVFRVWPNDLSPTGLTKVFNSIKPNSEFHPLSQSARIRSQADWLIGMNFTRLFTCLARRNGMDEVVSLGRVQTATFALIYKRCMEIENFKPVHHYGLTAFFDSEQGRYKGTLVLPENFLDPNGYCLNQSDIESVVNCVAGQEGRIAEVKSDKRSQSSPLPFSLSQLQAHCSSRFGYGAKQVLNVCQYLYETQKVLTYPRTDCSYLSEGDLKLAPTILSKVIPLVEGDVARLPFDTKSKPRCYDDKKTTAHTAIVPTTETPNFNIDSAELKRIGVRNAEVVKNIYFSVVMRFLAQFLPAHQFYSQTIITNCQGFNFQSKGKKVIINGWKDLYSADDFDDEKDDDEEEQEGTLPDLIAGDNVKCAEHKVDSKTTKPPPYFTEGSIIQAMANIARFVENPQIKQILKENDGIGTEATRADIIERLKTIKLISADGKRLKVTLKGRDLYPTFPDFLLSPDLTAAWESKLEQITTGQVSHEKFSEYVKRFTATKINEIKDEPPKMNITVHSRFKCRECSSVMNKRKGKYGHYWQCVKPECGVQHRDYNDSPLYPIEGHGTACPKCFEAGREDGILLTRIAKANPKLKKPETVFLGCNKYPDCDYAQWS